MFLISHKKIFLLSPFLFLIIPIQSMENTIELKRENNPFVLSDDFMQKIKLDKLEDLEKKQNAIRTKVLNNRNIDPSKGYKRIYQLAENGFFQENHIIITHICKTPKNFDLYNQSKLDDYSVLGLATMAVKSTRIITPIPYNEIKKFIKKMLKIGFKPTEKDTELAQALLWQRCLLIRKNIDLVYCAHKNKIQNLSQLPDEVLYLIAVCMLDTETVLF
jgi:hypothetical protein